jgi:hypothetical protein
MIRRKTYDKLPLQGNVYPMPTMAYIEDDYMRFTILAAQPSGVACLKSGKFLFSLQASKISRSIQFCLQYLKQNGDSNANEVCGAKFTHVNMFQTRASNRPAHGETVWNGFMCVNIAANTSVELQVAPCSAEPVL